MQFQKMENTLKRILKQEGVIGFIIIKITGGFRNMCLHFLQLLNPI